ncbi:MAG: hypothetical protein JOZ93_14220, partial [Sinobacteraceae bacterium]|nr:hypothetical protein [Nevskiaceae bacterium]
MMRKPNGAGPISDAALLLSEGMGLLVRHGSRVDGVVVPAGDRRIM